MKARGKTLAKAIPFFTSLVAANGYAVSLGTVGDTEVTLKGYIKLDAIYSDSDSGDLQGGGRDFYVPGATPVGGDFSTSYFDMHAKQSRVGIGTSTDVDGSKIKTYVEVDFYGGDGTETVSNTHRTVLRHAFMTYNNWLFGQTWSTFMDVGSLPESLDFIGNTDATPFVRQAQIRYTAGNFQFAMENPQSVINGVSVDHNDIPDLVARYNFKADSFNLTVAAISRQIQGVDGTDGESESTNGFGVAVSGGFKFGKDDLKFLVTSGSGLGRYIALATATDAVIDADGDLEAVDTLSYYVGYRHFWSESTRSTFSYSALDIDHDEDLVAPTTTEATNSFRMNLIHSPTANFSYGGEISVAERDIVGDDSGKLTRLQFSAKLTF